MLTTKHLDHLVLRVTDLAGMMAFYTNMLDCSVEKVQKDLRYTSFGPELP